MLKKQQKKIAFLDVLVFYILQHTDCVDIASEDLCGWFVCNCSYWKKVRGWFWKSVMCCETGIFAASGIRIILFSVVNIHHLGQISLVL